MNLDALSDGEIYAMMKEDNPLNRARQKFESACAELDLSFRQRTPPSLSEVWRMELQAVLNIAEALGVEI